MARGGRRPGAGRPAKAEKRGETPVRVAERKLRDRLPELVDVALNLAIEEANERMLIYCIDRVLGKPTQPIDVYDAARRLAEERGLDPDRVINLFDAIKRRQAAS
jgi:hypothetical protein